MSISSQERRIFEEIQKKLFYMIPEKWNAIYLYASINEEDFQRPIGEMYFYYLPKGILKRNPVNVYQIPTLFNIDDESYNNVVQSLYTSIKQLRNIQKKYNNGIWTNVTIIIKDTQFTIEYFYDDIGKFSEFNPYERHIIWRYENLGIEKDLMTKEEKSIIERYQTSNLKLSRENGEIHRENIYIAETRNIIDYEKTLTVEAALATQNIEEIDNKGEKKEKKKEKKKSKKSEENDEVANEADDDILFGRVEKMKNSSYNQIDDNMILSTEFMKPKEPK